MRYLAFAGVLLLFAGFAFGADIDGKWTGSLDMGGQKFDVNYTFKAEGSTLTGSTSIMDQPVNIKDGKINGNNISFSITFGEGDQGMKIDYKGVLTGDQLKLTFDMMGQSTDLLLKKVK
jgi:type V secretory pathway adhesin AidA